ncbi:polyprenyl diphosphate synthase [[Haemophilus] ducreyi]|uniref:polyprenyl diphosphate synthase n=2 Tax=Haemophilus ducreyi TaxID=730 RepID=UPI0008BAC70C|nr:polyprenyl diphosphate synthase [[Haemophilus] ducreyi]OOS04773.1 di-trans,poly-cis-decaprenylcistransferase [[Haemophilus] ducreyi]SEW05785.1 Undecaprenyl pyrophosphate synthetase [[Haemophilus] ducreyi]VEG83774.1 UPP synthase [[Haemophilus] ducreyi]
MNFDPSNMPQHVAIIMDGNGRWAKKQGKLRVFGHQNGVNAVRAAVRFAAKYGIKVLTLYAFSSENWNRPATEVSALMSLFIQALNTEVSKLHKHNIRLNILGDKTRFSDSLQKRIIESETLTAHNTRLTLNIAANYGSHWDITEATKKLAEKVKLGKISVTDITPEKVQRALVTAEQPPVDLLIRTSGEQRVSNFLLWQIAYAELFFSDVLWPDFDETSFSEAIYAYQQRERRFGGCE